MYKFIEKEGMTKIELIGKYKVLTRLYDLTTNTSIVPEKKEELEKVLEMFYACYPNFEKEELKNVYGIPVDNGVTLEIKTYSNQELELPNFPYYEELLYLNTLCNKILQRELFPTMVGQIYYRVGYKNSFYKVIYIEYKYGYEQLFVLQNLNNNSDIISLKLDEWCVSKLNASYDWCCSYESMIACTLNKKMKEFESTKKDLEDILDNINEGHICEYNVNLETEPGTWLKYKHGDDVYGRLESKPERENVNNNTFIVKIKVNGKTYDSTSWEILY